MDDRTARFAVNAVFLPEQASTVLISVVVGAILSVAGRVPVLPAGDPQVIAAGVAYGAVVAILLAITFLNRWRFPAILLDAAGFSTSALGVTTGATLWSRVDGVEIGGARFFGYPARVLRLKSGSAVVLEAPDFYFGWDDLVERTVMATGCPVAAARSESLRLRFKAMARDAMFGPRESILMFLARLPVRLLYLLPVVAMDLGAALGLFALIEGPASAWAAPLSLVASAFVARWVSWFLSTSLTLRPLVFPTDPARLAQVRRLEEEARRGA